MKSLHSYSNTLAYCLRALFILALFVAILSFVDGCSLHQKTRSQPEEYEFKRTGLASYYAKKFQSRKTASGEIFSNSSMTAAHKTLPFGTEVIVRNLDNGKTVKVRINDRGPFIKRRIIDLTKAAFSKIENLDKGFAQVEIMVVD